MKTKTLFYSLTIAAALGLSHVAWADNGPSTSGTSSTDATPPPTAAGDAAQSKSGTGPGGTGNPAPDSSTTNVSNAGNAAPAPENPPTGNPGQSKSGADPGSNGNPVGVNAPQSTSH